MTDDNKPDCPRDPILRVVPRPAELCVAPFQKAAFKAGETNAGVDQ